MSAESILEAKAVTKVYEIGSEKVHALTDADLSLAAGEMVLVLGPSGSGKSTLLYAMSGLEKPTKGHVLFKGEDIYALSERRMDRLRAEAFGFVFQAYNLIGNMTALENVEIPLRMAGAKGARKEAIAMLERVGLGHRINHRPGQLSGGEQQRVAIARALVRKPQVLCADEPTGNVDSNTGKALMAAFSSLVRERGTACLLVTHNAEWMDRADRAVYLKDGRVEPVPASPKSCLSEGVNGRC